MERFHMREEEGRDLQDQSNETHLWGGGRTRCIISVSDISSGLVWNKIKSFSSQSSRNINCSWASLFKLQLLLIPRKLCATESIQLSKRSAPLRHFQLQVNASALVFHFELLRFASVFSCFFSNFLSISSSASVLSIHTAVSSGNAFSISFKENQFVINDMMTVSHVASTSWTCGGPNTNWV